MATFTIDLLSGKEYLFNRNFTSGGTGGTSVITEDVLSMFNIGGIDEGETIIDGTTITDFVKNLLQSTFYPTYNNPTFSLTSNQSSNVEAGLITDIILTYNFNRGSINGKLVGGLWQPTTFQDYRSGAAIKYIIEGQDMLLINNRTLINQQLIDGANIYDGSVEHAIGPQPLDSEGQPYQSQYPANTVNRSTTINGRRRLFYGVSNLATTSVLIRALSGTLLNPIDGSTFTINIPIGATNVVFAYPATLQDITSVKYVEGLDAEIKDVFIQSIVSVEGLNAYNPINYKVYIYTPVESFSAVATYNCTI